MNFPLLITGGTGTLGSYFLSELVHRQIAGQIFVATRKPNVQNSRSGSSINYFLLDLRNVVNLSLPNVHSIVHLAGEKRNTDLMVDVNVEGTRRLIVAASKAGVKNFIYVSSVGIYGAPINSGIINESFHARPRNLYESSKYEAERILKNFILENNSQMRLVIIRPSTVLDFQSEAHRPLLGFMRAVNLKLVVLPSDSNGVLNYISTSNVAAALIHILNENRLVGDFNLNTPCRVIDAIEAIMKGLKVKNAIKYCNPLFFDLLGNFGDILRRYRVPFPVDSSRLLEISNSTTFSPKKLLIQGDFYYPTSILDEIKNASERYKYDGFL